jgi:hypothetical protein
MSNSDGTAARRLHWGLKETPMFHDNKPYAIMVIAAFVGFAVLLMFWTLYGTNGPSSLDATKKAPQTVGSTAPAADSKNR